MSLASLFDATLSGCVADPQNGVTATLPPALYQLKIWHGGVRTFYRFNFPVTLVWDAPSPPAAVRWRFYERPELDNPTDPILTVNCFLVTCETPGTFKGTSRWFWAYDFTYHFAGIPPTALQNIHLQEYKTNVGSVGIVKWPEEPLE